MHLNKSDTPTTKRLLEISHEIINLLAIRANEDCDADASKALFAISRHAETAEFDGYHASPEQNQKAFEEHVSALHALGVELEPATAV
jgi:hypothetical protein